MREGGEGSGAKGEGGFNYLRGEVWGVGVEEGGGLEEVFKGNGGGCILEYFFKSFSLFA